MCQNVVETKSHKIPQKIQYLLVIMTKINNVCVLEFFLDCLSQTNIKYAEALAHSGGLCQQSALLRRQIIKGRNVFLYSEQ